MQQNAAVFSLPEVELEGKMVEKWVFEQSCRFGLHLLKTILAGLDEELCRNRPSGWRHKGYEERTVQTALGKLSFSRRIYVNQFSGERVAPLDEYLGWEKHARVSPEVKAMCVEMAPEMSFRAVSWAVNRLRGIEVSAEAAHQIVQDYGSVRGEQVDAEIREMYEDPKSATGTKECTLFFEIDSMYARQQGPGKRNIEIKLGVVHEGWVRERSTQERYRLKNKKVVVDSRDGGHLWDRLTAALSKEYDLSRCKIIINGDGAEWIQKGIEYFPNAEFQLDKFHWLRSLRRAVANDTKVLRVLRRHLENEDWDAIGQTVSDLLETHPDRADAISGFWSYVSNHKGEIRDYRKRIAVELEITRGLGAAESNVDTVLVSRFKRHRRSWSRKGAQNLGNLVELRHNAQLSEWIQQYREVQEGVTREVQNSVTEGREPKRASFWARASVPYLKASVRPITYALRGLLDGTATWSLSSLSPRSA
jgi:hypothetical protein